LNIKLQTTIPSVVFSNTPFAFYWVLVDSGTALETYRAIEKADWGGFTPLFKGVVSTPK
jgi:hypothetical protein